MAVLKQLSSRGTIWPDSCADAVEHLVAALDQQNNDTSTAYYRVLSDAAMELDIPSQEKRGEQNGHAPSDPGHTDHGRRPAMATGIVNNAHVPSSERYSRR